MASQVRTSGAPVERPTPGQILLVIHDFTARSDDELSLSKGDRVKLVERDDEFGDGWYLGDHLTTAKRGLFPEVYTKPAPRGLPTVRAPTSVPISTGAVPRAQPATTQPVIKPVAVSNPIPESSFNTRNSVPAPEPDRTPQASRHVSASELQNNNNPIVNPPLITLRTDEDVSAGTAPLSSPTKISPPKNNLVASLAGLHTHDQESPVMNETLSVIQEHISDMSTPRHSMRDHQSTNDSGSEYSSHIDHRMSYINGEETDEEEENGLTELEVSQWTPDQVAEYLASVDVDEKHCQVFRDQEITGDVLLGMDQASIMLPQFELGPLGRRLKIWQRVKALQDDVKVITPAATRRTTQTYDSEISSEDSRRRSRSNTSTAALPKIIGSIADRPGSRQMTTRYSQQQQSGRSNSMQAISPKSTNVQDRTNTMQERSYTMDSPTKPLHEKRPSAASIRNLHHSRRFSSNDYSSGLVNSPSGITSESPTKESEVVHKKAPSFDRNWTMGSQSPSTPVRPSSSSGDKLLGNEEDEYNKINVTTPWEFDRGYFSGGDVDNRQRNVLRKRGSGNTHVHSRNSSYTDEQRIRSATTNSRHSRFGSVDSMHEPQHRSPASQKYYGMSTGRRKTSSNDIRPIPPAKDVPSPTVTKLDGSSSFRGTDSPRSPDQVNSPSWVQAGNQIASPRGMQFRATSEAVTGNEKARVTSPGTASPIKEDRSQSPSRTGSTTSGGPSFDLDSPNTSSKSPSTTVAIPGVKASRKKSKKETSAYIQGLEKKSPQEQMVGADYSGWMKKKSTNLMTTWKPRLFILKGRRLSYYYSEEDTEEKGLIDISGHRVLPADNDRLTGLHATLTGATTSPTSPSNAHTPTIASKEAAAEPVSTLSKAEGDSMFIFKLVPPRAGLSRAVNFTKPMVHYFAVPNITLGRLWMAALMKATIDRDDSKPIITTYQQKTISLEKARRMRHRPPALMNLDEKVEDEAIKTPAPDLSGLNIQGIIFDQEPYEGDSGVSGVSKLDSAAITSPGSNSAYSGTTENGHTQPQTA